MLFKIDLNKEYPSLRDQLDIVHNLAKINLSQDVLIIYANDYIRHTDHNFAVQNISTLKLEEKQYILPVIVCIPNGYFLDVKSLINGIKVDQILVNGEYIGITFDDGVVLSETANISVQNEIPKSYKIFKHLTIYFSEYNRRLLVNNPKVIGNFINPITDVFEFSIVRSHIGYETDINNVYFIKSADLYKRIPNEWYI